MDLRLKDCVVLITGSSSGIGNAKSNFKRWYAHRTLEGQSHDVNLQVLAPILIEFFTS